MNMKWKLFSMKCKKTADMEHKEHGKMSSIAFHAACDVPSYLGYFYVQQHFLKSIRLINNF